MWELSVANEKRLEEIAAHRFTRSGRTVSRLDLIKELVELWRKHELPFLNLLMNEGKVKMVGMGQFDWLDFGGKQAAYRYWLNRMFEKWADRLESA